MNKKIVALVLACVLMFSCIVAGTLAWLMDTSETVTNTFTFGKMDITLAETDGTELSESSRQFNLIPGTTTDKDPIVTVSDDSESGYVFVKLVKAGAATVGENAYDFDDFITIAMAEGWTALDGVAGVYYRAYTKDGTASNSTWSVFADDKVTCNGGVTQEMIAALSTGTALQLDITAYAIQTEAGDVATAWATFGA